MLILINKLSFLLLKVYKMFELFFKHVLFGLAEILINACSDYQGWTVLDFIKKMGTLFSNSNNQQKEEFK